LTPFKTGKFFDAFGRKTAGNVLLMLAKKINRENSRLIKTGIALGRLVHADQNQGRIERKRHEGIGRQPEVSSCFVNGSDNGDAGGEVAHYPAQFLWIDGHVIYGAKRPTLRYQS